MKNRLTSYRLFKLCGLMVMTCCVGPVFAGDAPKELRERAQDLERKAQELKADGQHEQAQQVMQELAEVRAQARRGQSPTPQDAEREELRRKHAEALADLKNLRAAGRQEAALERKLQILEMERRLEGMERPLPGRGERFGWRRGTGGPPAGGDEAQRRMQHLQAAIENLHNAGFHEQAERLAQQAEMMRAQARDRRFGSPAGAPQQEIQRLQAEVMELRRAVRELRARIEEMGERR